MCELVLFEEINKRFFRMVRVGGVLLLSEILVIPFVLAAALSAL
jgi:hypothetical protein